MSWPPGGLGVAWTCQEVPFQRSARVVTPELPTAVQADDDVHATPPRLLPCLADLGVGTIRHLLPFHRSASVPAALAELSNRPPTAMQAVRDVHATPPRTLAAVPDAFGVAWIRHLVPFHRSARVRPFAEFPTAVQAERDVHDTLARKPPPAGFGVAWIRHLVPFHRSARVLPFTLPPTAVQAERDMHDTLFSAPPPEGLGVAWMRQVRPFHRSARVATVPDLLVAPPTVTHAEREVHDTLLRELDAAPGGLGAAWRCQWASFHRSTTTAGD
ncbi:MAG TPA: hypothetical protein VF916_09750 [Ktedonobacterales bacterium]